MPTKDGPGPLPEPVSAHSPSTSSSKRIFIALIVTLTLLAKCTWTWYGFDRDSIDGVCSQVSELIPERNYELWESLSNTYSTDSFKLKAVNWLSGAIQVP